MFSGTYYHRVDEKGRIALPARFRAEFAQGVFLVPSVDRCLYVYPLTLWEKISPAFATDPFDPGKKRKMARYFYGGSSRTELDSQGRIPLPQDHRQKLNIKEDVVIVGVNEYLEIWDKETWEKEEEELNQEAAQLLESSEHENWQKKEDAEG